MSIPIEFVFKSKEHFFSIEVPTNPYKMVSVSNDSDPFSKGARNNQRDLCADLLERGVKRL